MNPPSWRVYYFMYICKNKYIMNAFNKISKPIITWVLQLLGVVAVFDWIIFPGLTTNDTMFNILALVVGIFTLIYLWFLFGLDKIVSEIWKDEK